MWICPPCKLETLETDSRPGKRIRSAERPYAAEPTNADLADLIRSQTSEVRGAMDSLEARVLERMELLETRNAELLRQNEELRRELDLLKSRQEEAAAYSRRNNVIVTGVPVTRNEDFLKIGRQLGELAGVEVLDRDIDAGHRLPARDRAKTSSVPLVFKFTNRWRKVNFMKGIREKAPTAAAFGGDANVRIYANEHLTAAASALFRRARDLRQVGYRFVWVRDGVVRARKDAEGSRPVLIRSLQQIEDLMRACS